MTFHLSRSWIILLFLLIGFVGGLTPDRVLDDQTPSHAARIWFVPRSQFSPAGSLLCVDLMDLFKPDAPWLKAASHVQIFKVYSQFLRKASDAQLKDVIVGLQQRHIALAAELGLMSNKNGPGKGEGYGGQNVGRFVSRLKVLGGNLQYVAMDEPLWFGHISNVRAALHTPIADIAKDVANQVATIHQYFPQAQVGDIEPVVGRAPSDYVEEVMQFADAYKDATGTPLAFFHSDVAHQGTGWQEMLKQLSIQTRAHGIKFGIIYDGDPGDPTGVAWTNDAEDYFAEVERDPSMVPDDAIIQSWQPQPRYALPETQPGTMTYLVDRYLAQETFINVSKTNSGYEGSLTTGEGKPVSNAQLSAYEIEDHAITWTTASVQGLVPADAVNALSVLRINNECNCKGPVDVLLRPADYLDNTTSQMARRTVAPLDKKIMLTADQHFRFNAKRFPVHAGDSFTFSVPMQSSYDSRKSGYVALIFLNKNGIEIRGSRLKLPFKPSQHLIWTGETDKNGSFTVEMVNHTSASPIVNFQFLGSEGLRLSSITKL